jgi:hypothetical protein
MELFDILDETSEMVKVDPGILPPEGKKLIDVVFFSVLVNEQPAEHHRQHLIDFLDTLPADVMAGGPSYIHLGGLIGDQGMALRTMGLGEALGLWKVITPRTLGFTDAEEIDKLAGNGLVMISGYKRG